jgi:hypothetical protein
MERAFPRRARLLEFAVAVAAIGVVSLLLLEALFDAQAEAEKLTVESTVRNMNSGLVLAQAALLVAGREAELPGLRARNPFGWLESLPAGYVGAALPAALEPGGWCWDAAAGLVVYRPRHEGGLKVADGVPLLRWRVQASADPQVMRPGALRIVAAVGYEWRP